MGPPQYIQWNSQNPEISAGPNVLAGFIDAPVSELVARVAAGKAARKEFTAIDALDANYVRPDEALYKTS